jgi:hypothetical protein
MTRADKNELGKYLRALGDMMGLRDWRFVTHFGDEFTKSVLTEDNEDDDEVKTMAECQVVPGQRVAEVKFSPSIRQRPTWYVREVVAHELVHCHVADMYEIATKGVIKELGQSTYNAWHHAYSLAWEHTVDDISRAWAEKLPLIRWPRAGKVDRHAKRK